MNRTHHKLRPSRSRRPVILVAAALFAVVVTGALGHVTIRLGVIRLGYAISEGSHERRELEEQNRRLRVELSLLRSPQRIEHLAADKLGMTRPEASQVRVLRTVGSVGPKLAEATRRNGLAAQ